MPPDWRRLTSEAFDGKPSRFISILASSAFFTSVEECLDLLTMTEVENEDELEVISLLTLQRKRLFTCLKVIEWLFDKITVRVFSSGFVIMSNWFHTFEKESKFARAS
jgi:hypothetical protein